MENIPFLSHMGIEIESWGPGRAVVRMPIGPHHLNRSGVVHGGIYTVLVDAAAGLAGCFCADPARRVRSYTISLTTSFLERADRGNLRAVGTVQRAGLRLYFAGARVECEGRLVATGEGSFLFADSSALEDGDVR